MLEERVLAPLIGAALLVSVIAIAWSIKRHRRRGPLVFAVTGAPMIACGRLGWSVPVLLYGGSGVLLGASLWNLWLKRRRVQPVDAGAVPRRTS